MPANIDPFRAMYDAIARMVQVRWGESLAALKDFSVRRIVGPKYGPHCLLFEDAEGLDDRLNECLDRIEKTSWVRNVAEFTIAKRNAFAAARAAGISFETCDDVLTAAERVIEDLVQTRFYHPDTDADAVCGREGVLTGVVQRFGSLAVDAMTSHYGVLEKLESLSEYVSAHTPIRSPAAQALAAPRQKPPPVPLLEEPQTYWSMSDASEAVAEPAIKNPAKAQGPYAYGCFRWGDCDGLKDIPEDQWKLLHRLFEGGRPHDRVADSDLIQHVYGTDEEALFETALTSLYKRLRITLEGGKQGTIDRPRKSASLRYEPPT